jgi:hypothetical protein
MKKKARRKKRNESWSRERSEVLMTAEKVMYLCEVKAIIIEEERLSVHWNDKYFVE